MIIYKICRYLKQKCFNIQYKFKANYDFNKLIRKLDSAGKVIIKQEENKKPILILTGTLMEKRGMMGNISIFSEWIYFALQKNYDLSIDLKYNKNGIISFQEIGITDGWELYFNQPFNISIDEALTRSNKYYIETHGSHGIKPKKSLSMNGVTIPAVNFETSENVDIWKQIVKKSMNFNTKTLQYCQNLFNKLIPKNEKVLGVLLRGTDYIKLQPYAHPIQPTKEQAFEQILKTCKNENIKTIFLSTEDLQIYTYINNECHKNNIKVIINPNSNMVDLDTNEQLINFYNKKQVDLYNVNINYLANIYILANCSSLISGSTSATKFIRILNRIYSENKKISNYNSEYIFNLGHYGISE